MNPKANSLFTQIFVLCNAEEARKKNINFEAIRRNWKLRSFDNEKWNNKLLKHRSDGWKKGKEEK